MKTVNIIGPGRVGRTLAALFHGKRVFHVQSVAGTTLESARAGVSFIGAGSAAAALSDMPPADVWLLTTPDRHIARVCETLAASGLLRGEEAVLHCSGALTSAELVSAAALGAHVASVHPLKTFATPEDAVRTFEGTPCVAEGDAAALAVLQPAFEQIGARVLHIESSSKTLYHAASVIVCNYLVALIESGLRCYEGAGIARDDAAAMIEPIVRETVDNIFKVGTAGALTGPISRGDDVVVARHLEALGASDPQVARIYRELGLVALGLAKEQGRARAETLARIEALLVGRD